jgi:sec-independent protein translocase protein TatB
MLDIGFPEFLLISFVLLIVVGPKDLPKVLRSISSFVRKIKSMATQFHSGIDDLANEAEISDLRNQVQKLDDKSIMNSEIDELKSFEDDLNINSIKKHINEINNSNNKKKKSHLKTKKT